MPTNKDRSFSGRLDWSGHLGYCGNRDFCGSLVYGLSGRNSEGLSLDGGGGRLGSSSVGSIRDVKKIGRRVLRLCDSLIKVFNIAFCLSNYIFLCLQILQYFGNHLEDPPSILFSYLQGLLFLRDGINPLQYGPNYSMQMCFFLI